MHNPHSMSRLRRAAVLPAIFGALRLAELAWSRAHLRRLRRLGGKVVSEPRFSAMVALHTAVLLATPLEASRRRPPPRAVSALSLAALGLASVLRGYALGTLGEAWSVRVTRFSKGARPIVTGGPYRFIRHPNYLAMIVELAALPLAVGAPLTALFATVLDALLLARRIPLEERELFSDPRYRAAFRERPRFLPRLHPHLRPLPG